MEKEPPNDESVFKKVWVTTKKMFFEETPNDDPAVIKLWEMTNELTGSLGIKLNNKQETTINEKLTNVAIDENMYDKLVEWIKNFIQPPVEKEGIYFNDAGGSFPVDQNM